MLLWTTPDWVPPVSQKESLLKLNWFCHINKVAFETQGSLQVAKHRSFLPGLLSLCLFRPVPWSGHYRSEDASLSCSSSHTQGHVEHYWSIPGWHTNNPSDGAYCTVPRPRATRHSSLALSTWPPTLPQGHCGSHKCPLSPVFPLVRRKKKSSMIMVTKWPLRGTTHQIISVGNCLV